MDCKFEFINLSLIIKCRIMEHSKNTKKEPGGIFKLFLLLLCIAGTSVFSQVLAATDQEPLKVTGIVFDELDTPLPGATVQVDKSTKGVITDLDGKFEIEVLPTDKLLVSYVGYETKLVTIGDKKSLVVKLETKANELQDVTVVAFGKQKKESMTSAIETINPKELKLPTGNLTAALVGRLAGVISYQKSGEPGKDNAEFFVVEFISCLYYSCSRKISNAISYIVVSSKTTIPPSGPGSM